MQRFFRVLPVAIPVPVLAAVAVLSAGAAAAAPPSVAADIAPVHALVARVMQGSGAAPALVLPAAQSPHHAALRPSQARALAGADLVVWVDPALSPALARAVDAAAPPEILGLLDLADTLRLPLRSGVALVEDDHGHGTGHGEDTAGAGSGGHAHDAAAAGAGQGRESDHGHDAAQGAGDDHGQDPDHGHGAAGTAGDGHDAAGTEGDGHGHEAAAAGHDHGVGSGDGGHRAEEEGDDHGHDAADPGHGHAPDQGGDVIDAARGGPDDGAAADLHAWLDPGNASVWLAAIAERLAALDPANAGLYRANAAAGQAEMAALAARIAAALPAEPGMRFVLLHDFTRYFEARFGLDAVASLSDGDAASPGPARLAAVRAATAANGVSCLIAEPQHDRALVTRLSGETGAPVVEIDPLGATLEPGAELYPALLEQLAAAFAACQGG